MDIHNILSKEVQQFINDNLDVPIAQIALKKNPFTNIDWTTIVGQIQAKQKAKQKLPTWFQADNIVYPSAISIEQTSSEPLAQHKSKQISGNNIIDLTGGFGIDAFYFSKNFSNVVHCEYNEWLSSIVKHNFDVLQVQNIECISGDSQNILKNLHRKFDWIYIDPARRDNAKQKVFLLKDCSPNVPELLDFYFEYSDNILIKTAPLLDIDAGVQELKHVKKIEIISLKNEVKELLWYLEKGYEDAPIVVATELQANDAIQFFGSLKDDNYCELSLPLNYLYEPFHALLKTGNFNAIGNTYQLKKLHQPSHLYTSETLVDFPGRIFEIQEVFAFGKKEVAQKLSNKKMHISTRNFPLKPEELRKKFKLNDGGEDYVFFTTNKNSTKIVICCKKI